MTVRDKDYRILVSEASVDPKWDAFLAETHGGWSGRHGRNRPNEAMDWATIKWAKSRGYRYYDLDGIEAKAAEALARGEKLPSSVRRTPTFYKVGLGGEARLLPKTCCYIFNPFLRVAYKSVFHIIRQWLPTTKALGYVRTRRSQILGSRAHGH